MKRTGRSILGVVFLTVFLDIVGFSVIFPLFPAMLEHYLALEGEHSAIGSLVARLSELAGQSQGGAGFAVAVLFGGVLGSIYSVLQFVAAPLWGALSDRIGRRPTLLVTLAGTAVAHAIWFFAGGFWLLVAARMLGGVMAGNISTASAAIADSSEGHDRARGMGVLGAAIGLGFVIGPALGGVSSLWVLTDTWPGGVALGVNPFSSAAAISFALGILNLVWAARSFPETLDEHTRGKLAQTRTWNPFAALRRIDAPGVKPANLAYFAYLSAFGAMEFTLTFLAVERFDYEPRHNAWMFVYIGVLIALVQGGLVRRLAPRLGEKRMATMGLELTLPGFVIVGLAPSSPILYLGLTFLAFGSGLVMPALSALVSRYTPEERQGLGLGVFRSMGSLARAVGPILGGVLYWKLGSLSPYLVGAGILLLPIVMAMRLPPVAKGR